MLVLVCSILYGTLHCFRMKTVPSANELLQTVNPRVCGRFIVNLGGFQTELARIVAGFVPTFVIWRQRKELPELVFRSLRRVQDLRERGRELGVSFEEMHYSANVPGRALLDQLCHAESPADLLKAGMIEIHGTLIDAIDDYLQRNKGIYDLPSVALLEADREELKKQMGWAQSALHELAGQCRRNFRRQTFVPRTLNCFVSRDLACPVTRTQCFAPRTPAPVEAGAPELEVCHLPTPNCHWGFIIWNLGRNPCQAILPTTIAPAITRRIFFRRSRQPIPAPRCCLKRRICPGIFSSI